MLVAQNGTGKIIADNARRNQRYYCPECHSPVVLRRGKINIAHFAHVQASNCAAAQGESCEHIMGKQQICQWAADHGWQPELEYYCPAIAQRPDILAHVNGQLTVLEFQCSPLSLRRLRERNRGYEQAGWRYYWLLGSPYRRQLGRIKQAQFLQIVSGQVTLPFWNVRTGQLECRSYPQRRPIVVSTRVQQQLTALQNSQESMITDLQYRLMQYHHYLIDCPTFCHFPSPIVPSTKHHLVLWRIQVASFLMTAPLFTSWSRRQWIHHLYDIGQGEWTVTPCLPNNKVLARLEVGWLTGYLIKEGYLMVDGVNLILLRHPLWFNSWYEKQIALRKAFTRRCKL